MYKYIEGVQEPPPSFWVHLVMVFFFGLCNLLVFYYSMLWTFLWDVAAWNKRNQLDVYSRYIFESLWCVLTDTSAHKALHSSVLGIRGRAVLLARRLVCFLLPVISISIHRCSVYFYSYTLASRKRVNGEYMLRSGMSHRILCFDYAALFDISIVY